MPVHGIVQVIINGRTTEQDTACAACCGSRHTADKDIERSRARLTGKI